MSEVAAIRHQTEQAQCQKRKCDRRAAAWFFFTFYPKVLTEHAGTVYLAPIADNTGRPLQAGKTYKLRVPKDIPVKQFWSLTVYDRATWAFVKNPLDRAGLGSFNKDTMQVNADGSVDLYFGPNAPAGLESNWIPTMGKGAIPLAPALCSGRCLLEEVIQDARCRAWGLTAS
jgi:hypothetical protein